MGSYFRYLEPFGTSYKFTENMFWGTVGWPQKEFEDSSEPVDLRAFIVINMCKELGERLKGGADGLAIFFRVGWRQIVVSMFFDHGLYVIDNLPQFLKPDDVSIL